jgi:hypothetical protein
VIVVMIGSLIVVVVSIITVANTIRRHRYPWKVIAIITTTVTVLSDGTISCARVRVVVIHD